MFIVKGSPTIVPKPFLLKKSRTVNCKCGKYILFSLTSNYLSKLPNYLSKMLNSQAALANFHPLSNLIQLLGT